MRILTFIHSFEPGGVERTALRLNRAWADAGHEVLIVVGRDEGAGEREADGLPVTFLGPGRPHSARWEHLWMMRRLPAVVRRWRPDVLFCAGNTYTAPAVFLKMIWGRRCPPVAAKVSNDFDRRDFGPVMRAIYHGWVWVQGRFIDRFVGIAEPMRAQIARFAHLPPEQVSVVNDPAVRADEIEAYAREPRPPARGRRFLAVGRMSAQKNFARALAAFAAIARPDDTLTILGEGPERVALTRQAEALGVAARVAMPGFVTDLPRRYAQADVLVLSSDYEGVPAVIVDALAAGLAIVATDCSISMRDLLDDGRLGTLVPMGDDEALARALDRADVRAVDAAAARAHARRFTLEAAAPAWAAVLGELARWPLPRRPYTRGTRTVPVEPYVAKGR